jgi:rapamycin-insensitive companion of mTOR
MSRIVWLNQCIRALVRDSQQDYEREQALKLIRAFVDNEALAYVPQSVVRALVAIAEQASDKLRNICLETLAEICKLNN